MAGTAVPLVGRPPDAVLFRAPGQAFTCSQFLADAHRVAAALPARCHVVNLCQDRYWFAVALAAALLRGQVSLLASDRSPARLRALAERFEETGSVSEDPGIASPLPHQVIGTGRTAGTAPNPAIPADRLAAIVFTSGTTGEPVPHRKLWGALAERSRAAALRFGLDAAAPVTVIGTVPPQHMYGFETTVLLPLHAPAASWCGPVFYPADARAALAAAPAPRILVTTPLQLRALLQAALPEPPEAVISATAPLAPEMAEEAERRWGAPVHEIFGATEVGSIAARRTTREEAWTLYPGVELAVDGDQALASGPFAPPCPLSDRLEATGDGGFRLLGRGDDVLKLGGRRTSHAGLNRILTQIEGVEDGVFVVPDDLDRRPSARLVAFVVAPGRLPQDILAELRTRLDPVFLPRRVIRVPALPRNTLGKLPRDALRALQQAAGRG